MSSRLLADMFGSVLRPQCFPPDPFSRSCGSDQSNHKAVNSVACSSTCSSFVVPGYTVPYQQEILNLNR